MILLVRRMEGVEPGLWTAEGRNRHVVDGFWRLGGGAGVEWGLRIVFDGELNGLGHFGSGDLRREGEGEIDASRDAGAVMIRSQVTTRCSVGWAP